MWTRHFSNNFLILLMGLGFLNAEPIQLRVGIVENPRFPSLEAREHQVILEETSRLAREQYDLEIFFVSLERESIQAFFENRKAAMKREFRPFRYIRRIAPDTQEELFRSLMLEYLGTPHSELFRFAIRAEERLASLDLSHKGVLLEKVAEIHLEKLLELSNYGYSDGEPLLEDNLYHQFMAWYFFLQMQEDYEVLLTNQLLASVETFHPEIHVSLRGGVATGFVSPSNNPTGGAVLVSLFPILSNLEFFNKQRKQAYDSGEIRDSVVFMLMHELLHLLDHRKHYFDHEGCLMNPAPGFQYHEWVQEIRESGFCLREHPKSDYLLRTLGAP